MLTQTYSRKYSGFESYPEEPSHTEPGTQEMVADFEDNAIQQLVDLRAAIVARFEDLRLRAADDEEEEEDDDLDEEDDDLEDEDEDELAEEDDDEEGEDLDEEDDEDEDDEEEALAGAQSAMRGFSTAA